MTSSTNFPDSNQIDQKELRKVAAASLVGTMIEWYDYFIYGTASALVFGKLFFPNFEPLVGTLLALASFGVGFLARPLGGIVIGHFGDRIGRKKVLISTLWIMAVATILIGLLPGYQSIGIYAPIGLVILRLVQGFGVGGEWGGAVLLIVEHSPDSKRGFFGSLAQLGVPLGMGLATIVFGVVASLCTEEQLLDWGWRIPFLFSFALLLVGFYIRAKIKETPAFENLVRRERKEVLPISKVVLDSPLQLIKATGTRIAENGSFYIFSTFILFFATTELGLSREAILNTITVAILFDILSFPLFGKLSDRYGRRPIYMFGAAFTAIFAFPFFWLVNTQSVLLIQIALILALSVAHGSMYAVQGALLAEMFPANIRYSGMSLASQIASVVAGGLSPFLATLLFVKFGYPAVAIYIVIMAIITFISVFTIKETAFLTNTEIDNQ